ncbi:MAG: 16S rRNA (cytosine(1402)-N(4))-methyltransferase RsmH [Oscillospiraceae bacterium]|nr:16S rRNA (cytosine(1402)-N(4))-methyltransferase RsmH [Oscillospiraceae bacterium]
MNEFYHYSVLLKESITLLNIKPDGVYVDLTLGGGGHSLEILKHIGSGRLIAFDRDSDAIAASKKRLTGYEDKITYINDNFINFASTLDYLGIKGVDGVIADLGVSSFQLDTPSRGFSYHAEAPLDMRMSKTDPLTARDVVNNYPADKLKHIIYEYGEENAADRITRAIINARGVSPIETTTQLAEIIKSAFPPKARFEGKHPARRTFQAIRIEVNNELEIIPQTLNSVIEKLNSGGVVAVISFHSLEDRAVKETFKRFSNGCTCPREFPVCVCGFKPSIEILTKKPITADSCELDENLRSRSAKLRAAKKL